MHQTWVEGWRLTEAAAVLLVVVGCVRFATGALLRLPCWFLPSGAVTGLLLTSDSVLLVKIPKSGDVQVIQTEKKKLEANRNSHRTKKTSCI